MSAADELPTDPAQRLWATKYGPLWTEERAKEEARREQAFLDLPILVCGEDVRVMTAMDLFVLSGCENSFVCGREPGAGDVGVFLWWLHVDNDGSNSWANRWRRRMMLHRLASRKFDTSVREIVDYIDMVFQDSPATGGGEDQRRPLGTCFLAPLLRKVTAEMGPVDPVSGNPIAGAPLPRVFQYLKAAEAANRGKDFVDFSPSDRLTGEFLAELNAINHALAADASAN